MRATKQRCFLALAAGGLTLLGSIHVRASQDTADLSASDHRDAQRRLLRPTFGMQFGMMVATQVGLQQHVFERLGYRAQLHTGGRLAPDGVFAATSVSALLGPFGPLRTDVGLGIHYVIQNPDLDASTVPRSRDWLLLAPTLGVGFVLGSTERGYLGARFDVLGVHDPSPLDEPSLSFGLEFNLAVGHIARRSNTLGS